MPRSSSAQPPSSPLSPQVRGSQRRSSTRRSSAFNYDKNPRRSLSASIHAPNRGIYKRSSGGVGEEGGVEEEQEGTIAGVTFNTLCCVMGAGVLSLPYAMRNGSVGLSLLLMGTTTIMAAFAVYILACGCDLNKKYSYTECLAYSVFPDIPIAQRRARKKEAKRRRKEERQIEEATRADIARIERTHENSLQNAGTAVEEPSPVVENHQPNSLIKSDAGHGGVYSDSDDHSSTEDDSDLDEGIYDPKTESHNQKMRRWITMIMEAIIFLNNYGSITVYSRVIADSIPPVLNDFFGAGGAWTSTWLWIVGPGLVFFLLSCARGMEELKWTSIVGFVTIFYIVILVIVRFFTNMDDPIAPGIKMHDGMAADVNWLTISLTCFSTVSTYGLAFGFHYNVPYFYRELRDRRPEVLMQTISMSFPIICMCYISTGLLGYLTFGSLVADSHAEGNIVNNYNSHDVAANIGRLGLFFHFGPVYPIISICCRRALHRLTCLAFVKPVLPLEALGENEIVVEEQGSNEIENNYADSSTAEKQSLLPSSASGGGNPTHTTVAVHSGLGHAAPGDPSTTKTSSIVIEAFLIVSTSSLIAAFVPGIGVVVELVGALFGIPLMFLFPGIIGYYIFTDELAPFIFNKSSFFRALSVEDGKRAIWWLNKSSVLIAVVGAFFQFCGILAFGLSQAGVIH